MGSVRRLLVLILNHCVRHIVESFVDEGLLLGLEHGGHVANFGSVHTTVEESLVALHNARIA